MVRDSTIDLCVPPGKVTKDPPLLFSLEWAAGWGRDPNCLLLAASPGIIHVLKRTNAKEGFGRGCLGALGLLSFGAKNLNLLLLGKHAAQRQPWLGGGGRACTSGRNQRTKYTNAEEESRKSGSLCWASTMCRMTSEKPRGTAGSTCPGKSRGGHTGRKPQTGLKERGTLLPEEDSNHSTSPKTFPQPCIRCQTPQAPGHLPSTLEQLPFGRARWW